MISSASVVAFQVFELKYLSPAFFIMAEGLEGPEGSVLSGLGYRCVRLKSVCELYP